MKNSKIKSIKAREILDSRGNPTVEVELTTDFGVFRDSSPSGASKGKYEAKELRDGGKRYQGKGVARAVQNVNKIIGPKLKGKDVTRQKEIDELMIELDGTENKSKLGANAIVAVSQACCRAGADSKNIPLYQYIAEIYHEDSLIPLRMPKASFNIINGGAHAGNELDFQEFMIVPQSEKFSKNLRIAAEIYHELKRVIKKKYGELATNIGDEGGFAPPLKAPEEAISLILKAAKNAGYIKDKNIRIILDVAASQFYLKPVENSRQNQKSKGKIRKTSNRADGKYKTKIGVFTRDGFLNYYSRLIKKYPIMGLEDPFSETDWKGWESLNSKLQTLNSKFLIIGDDLLVTNPARIKIAYQKKACNGLLLKINQIGTVTEALEAAKLAKSYSWKIMVSHRSGETCDDFIADLAVGIGTDFIKSGAPARGERMAKYNRLLKIEKELKS